MPPKKTGRKPRKETPPPPGSKSTAKIFQQEASEIEADSSVAREENELQPTQTNQRQAQDDDDDISNASFPVKIIYYVQDFLNENLNFLYFVQILVFGFITQLTYLNLEKFSQLEELLPVIGFNGLGVCVGILFSYMRGEADDPTKKLLPDFGYLYSVLLPLFLNVVHYNPGFFLVNLSLNYFIIDRLNPLFRVLSSVLFYEMYNENKAIPTFTFIQIAVVHAFISFTLNYINDGNLNSPVSTKSDQIEHNSDYNKSFRKSEIQLLTLILINVFFNTELVNGFVPLLIFQKLTISLIVSILVAYPVYSFLPGFGTIGLFSSVFYFLTNYQLSYVLNTDNAVVWLYEYIFENEQNLYLLKIWVGILAVAVPVVFYNVDLFSLNSRRKIWHFVAIAILFVTPNVLVEQVEFTLIGLLGSIILFLIVEILRFNELTFIGKFLFDRLVKFQDYKDLKGPLNLSYIYLLIGITLPIVYDYVASNDGKFSIIRYIGIVVLGLGDSAASFVGKRFGSFKWKGGDKSVQGSVAFIVASFGGLVFVDSYLSTYHPIQYVPINKSWENIFVAVLVAALLEGTSLLNDNFFVPIILPIAYEILNVCYAR